MIEEITIPMEKRFKCDSESETLTITGEEFHFIIDILEMEKVETDFEKKADHLRSLLTRFHGNGDGFKRNIKINNL